MRLKDGFNLLVEQAEVKLKVNSWRGTTWQELDLEELVGWARAELEEVSERVDSGGKPDEVLSEAADLLNILAFLTIRSIQIKEQKHS